MRILQVSAFTVINVRSIHQPGNSSRAPRDCGFRLVVAMAMMEGFDAESVRIQKELDCAAGISVSNVTPNLFILFSLSRS